MEISKVKNIFIIALVIVNIFLLFLVVPKLSAQSSEQKAIGESLTGLFADKQISLDWSIVPNELELYELEISTDALVESNAASAVLGASISTQDDTGIGKRVYEGQYGSAEFRKTGEFGITLTVQQPPADSLELAAAATLELLSIETSGAFSFEVQENGKIKLTTTQVITGVPIGTASVPKGTAVAVPLYSSAIVLTYDEQNRLEHISGKWYTSRSIAADSPKSVSAKTALVAFLSSRDSLGWVCTSVTAVEQGYVEESSPAYGVSNLVPVWMIETDTGAYYVDGLTCSVSPVGS